MLNDFLGNEIKVGSKIVYPGRSGSNLWMNYGEVIDFGMTSNCYGTPFNYLKVKRKSRYDWETDNKIVTIYCLDRVAVVGDEMKEEFRDIPVFTNELKVSAQPTLNVKLKLIHPDAKFPRYAKPGDAGMDLFAVSMEETKDYIEYDTGIALEIPFGYVGLLFPRSSNSKKDMILANSAGVIDSGYRGTLRLRYKCVTNGRKKLIYNKYNIGDAVGQIMILPYPHINFIQSEELSDSERGEGGFGHTGN